MCATSHLAFPAVVAAVLFITSQAYAQSDDLNNVPPPHAMPSAEARAAIDQALQGNMSAGVEALRILAKESDENSFYLGMLLYSWRTELALHGKSPLPPVDWEMDWLRCSAVMADAEGGEPMPPTLLAEYYFNDDLRVKPRPWSPEFRISGPWRSLALSRCWSDVSEGISTAKSCIAQEEDWRSKRKLPAFTCCAHVG
jgi:hypothetical protein